MWWHAKVRTLLEMPYQIQPVQPNVDLSPGDDRRRDPLEN
jgi:hypothetical protein